MIFDMLLNELGLLFKNKARDHNCDRHCICYFVRGGAVYGCIAIGISNA